MTRRRSSWMLASSILVSFAAMLASGGCTLLFVDTGGLSGGADAQAADGEGGARTGDERGVPLGDASGADATFTLDGAGAVDGAVGFCVANAGHEVCDDFDDRPAQDVTLGWSKYTEGRGAVRGDSARARSAPNAFLAETAAGPSGVSVAHITRPIGEANRVRLSFDVFVTPPPGPVGDSFVTINFPGRYFDVLWFEGGAFWITERGTPGDVTHVATQKIPASTWVRLQIETTPGRLTATVDGATALDVTTSRTYSGAADVYLGLYSNDPYAIGFSYDNVLIDTMF